MQGLRETLRENTITDRSIGRMQNNYEIPDKDRKEILTKCDRIDDVLNSLSMDSLLKRGSMLSYPQMESMIQMEVAMQLKDVFQKEFELDKEDDSQEQEIQFAKCALINDEIGKRVQKFMKRLMEYHKNNKTKNRNKR